MASSRQQSRRKYGREKGGPPDVKPGDSKPGGAPSKSEQGQVRSGHRSGGLYVVATPIGNLGDFNERARATLAGVAVIACEDTRVSGVLLTRFGIATPTVPYHEHNAERMRPQLLARLQNGESIALISDAGTPLISDPGYKLVRAAIDAGITVIPVPGASAVMTALVAAGLPTDRFMFAGFLPSKSSARRRALEEVGAIRATLVFFDAANRAAESLADMAGVFGARDAALCRELTKMHEEIRRGSLAELAASAKDDPPRGEVVLVVAGAPEEQEETAFDLDGALRDALAHHRLRDAVDLVAAASGKARREVYARALALTRGGDA